MSEDTLLLEVMRKEFQQVAGVALVIVLDVGEEVVQPLAHIDLRQFAASHKGVDDGSVLGGIKVSAEKIVLTPQSHIAIFSHMGNLDRLDWMVCIRRSRNK